MKHKKTIYGLIGRTLSHSFSPRYFAKKFEKLKLNSEYQLFDIADISNVRDIAANDDIAGLNVTIPYKQSVLQHLDKVSKNAAEIGAVNTIVKLKNGKLKGYNTDWIGFKQALKPLLRSNHDAALILGTGGSAKAVAFALRHMGIQFLYVSRNPNVDSISYDDIDLDTFNRYPIIINCTPLGTFPNTEVAPNLPYHYFTSKHIAFDLIYNPEETKFMKLALANGAVVSNGYQMLVNQAEKSYKIWSK